MGVQMALPYNTNCQQAATLGQPYRDGSSSHIAPPARITIGSLLPHSFSLANHNVAKRSPDAGTRGTSHTSRAHRPVLLLPTRHMPESNLYVLFPRYTGYNI